MRANLPSKRPSDAPDSATPTAPPQRSVPSNAASRFARWYVAQTHPRSENWAIEHLARQGFETFFPRFRKRQIRWKRDLTVLAPVFPGYVFVTFDIEADSWPVINSTYGVRRLIGSRLGKPQPLPEAAMQLLHERCDNGVMGHLLTELQPGDSVKINSGPLFQKIATIESIDEKGRVTVLLELLGSFQSIDLPLHSIGPVDNR